jgi:hypothetical protein
LGSLTDELAAEAAAAPKEDKTDSLAAIKKHAAEAARLSKQVEGWEADIAKAKTRRYEIVTKDLVEIMNRVGVPRIEVDQIEFYTDMEFKASISADWDDDKKNEAYRHLEQDLDAGDLINYQVTTSFPKDSEELAHKFMEFAAEWIKNNTNATIDMEVKKAVPWKRLSSWLKVAWEMRQDPARVKKEKLKPIDLDKIGGSVFALVRMKPAK